jgi:hypothetical protein
LRDYEKGGENPHYASHYAKDIDDIIESGFLRAASRVKLKILVLGPSSESSDYAGLRVPSRNRIREMGHDAEFPEEISDVAVKKMLNDRNVQIQDVDNLLSNWTAKELILIRLYDFAVVLVVSPGSISEFSTFFANQSIASKMRVYVRQEHLKADSYIAAGPLDALKKVHNNVEGFDEKKDLLEKIEAFVRNAARLKFISGVYS